MKLRTLFAAATIALWIIGPALAHELSFSALLTGANESPSTASGGMGSALVTFDLDVVTMRVEIQFSDLVGNVTASHLHAATTTPDAGTAIVASQLPTFPSFPLGGTSGTYDQTIDLTTASSYNPAFITASGGMVSDALNALIFASQAGKSYLNIDTTAFPDGEIRGFLIAVPKRGDFNRDAFVDAADVPTMLTALTDLSAYKISNNLTDSQLAVIGDVNGDGKVTNADIQAELNFVASGGGGSVSAVPEPASWILLLMGALVPRFRRGAVLRLVKLHIRKTHTRHLV